MQNRPSQSKGKKNSFGYKKLRLKHLDKGSFLALLVKSFVSFTIIIALAVSISFVVSYLSVDTTKQAIAKSSISNYSGYLESGRYNGVPISSLFGNNGWFDVVKVSVDSDNVEVVYSSRSNPDTYTLGELEYIQVVGLSEDVSVNIFLANNGENNYLITMTTLDENGQKMEKYLLLDANYRVISGTISGTKTQYTQREFDLMTHNATKDNGILYKWSFKGDDGLDYYAICLDTRVDSNTATYIFIALFVVFVVLCCVLVVWWYVRYLNKHVVKPLSTLSNAMNDFAKDGFREQIEYKGSTEFEQLCNSFNDMVSLLNATDEQKKLLEEDKRRMLAGLSHDLKTPITIIQGFTKAIRDGVVGGEDAEKYLQLILSKSEYMGDLINEFYEYVKLDHPDYTLNFEECDVCEIAREFLVGIYDEFDLNEHKLDTNICDDELIAMVDKKNLTRVFQNLTANFFRYTKKGSTLYFGVDRVDDKVRIIIADDGQGIDKESREDIFKAFVVAEKSRNKQGTGLGLAVCEKIVQMHGGSIRLCDETIQGYNTQFEILLNLK